MREASEGTAPVALVANPQTGAFWGSHSTVAQLAAYLERGDLEAGPESDWAVGHFVGLLGLDEGRAGTLIMVVDTYPRSASAACTCSRSSGSWPRSRAAACS